MNAHKTTSHVTKKTQFTGTAQVRFRKRHPLLWALVPIALVVVVFSTLVITKVADSSSAAPSASKLCSRT
jgi:hypothetical protein